MALALYRKYRPRTFAEVIGQDHVTAPLIQALRTGRLHHAYLFSGPRGCGKTSSARILARSLNCEKGPTPEPCGECDSCRALAPDGPGSIDVIEIDAASHGGVDDARDLRERAFFAPVSSRFKVYVIDEAHMVSTQGFNALLKLVEEPPSYIKFIFATTEPEKVLGTIRSRTHHYPFRLIPPGVMRPHLEQLCAAEGIAVEPAVFPLVVRAGGGSARDSQSVLDQLIAGAGEQGVTYAHAVALLGVTDSALLDEVCDALAAADGATAYAAVDKVAEAGHDPRRFASDLLERLRDLIILQQVPDAIDKGIIDGPPDELDRMAAQASHFGPATLSRMADMLHNGLTEMRGTTNPRLLLELVLARMLLPGADDSAAALLQRMERMERRLAAAPEAPFAAPAAVAPAADPLPAPAADPAGHHPTGGAGSRDSGVPAAVAPASQPPREEAPASPPEAAGPSVAPPGADGAAPGQLDVAAVRLVWDDLLAAVRRKSQKTAALARDAIVRALDGDTVVLVVKSSALATMLTDNSALLVEALYERFGGTWQIRCEVGGDAAQRFSPGSAPAQPARSGGAPRPAQGRDATRAAPQGAGRQSGGQGRGPGGAAAPVRATPAPSGDDDDWPDTAQPGSAARAAGPNAAAAGAGQVAPAGVGPSLGTSGSGTGLEEAARPSQPPSVSQAGQLSAATQTGQLGAAAQAGPAAARNPAAAMGPAARAGAAARAAAAARAGTAGRGTVPEPGGGLPRARTAPAVARTPGMGRADDGPPADEPPFDPDYDKPSGDRFYDGFDPGDEPLDDETEASLGTSEEQALRLLAEKLGAEKISETPSR
ncbi:DNA polymerase III subunit gamma and tau [Luedemannella helvata]|uniref:DNA-directed DNA polymerase n=1 Tax=Luedemannella helvata TaxID=349315 RepID=A0ABP4W6Z0_9ACTN